MNDLGHGIGELERRITQGLHRHSRLAPEGDGWEAILDRIERRGRVRQRRRVAATGLVLVAMVGSVVALTGGGDTRVSTTPARPDTPASPTPAATSTAAAAGLPRLVFEVPGFSLLHASAEERTESVRESDRFLVYTTSDDGLLGSGAVLFARLVPPGAAYGLGDGPTVTDVDVAGQPGRLTAMTTAARSLGWSRPDGSIVHVIALGVATSDLLQGGQAIEQSLALGGGPPAELPGGVALRRTMEAGQSASAWTQSELSYQSGSRIVGLRLTSGDGYTLDALLLDRLASAEAWRAATVAGRPAVLSTYEQLGSPDQATTLMWSPSEGVVAEMSAHGLTEAELEAAAASIQEVDEAGWQSLLAAVPPAAPVALAVGDDSLAEVGAETCRVRDQWLNAVGAGDQAAMAAAVSDLRTLLGKGRAAGVGENGDILVVIERLLDAMAARDAASVSSIPEGGLCS
jgi:hypothetical protein